MIDPKTETLRTLAETAQRLPTTRVRKDGSPIDNHRGRVRRMILRGELEGIRILGQWYSSDEAIERMLDRALERTTQEHAQ